MLKDNLKEQDSKEWLQTVASGYDPVADISENSNEYWGLKAGYFLTD
jgi:hypothetical protein